MNSRTDTLVRLSIGLTARRDLLPEEGPALRATRCEFPQGLRAEFPVLPL